MIRGGPLPEVRLSEFLRIGQGGMKTLTFFLVFSIFFFFVCLLSVCFCVTRVLLASKDFLIRLILLLLLQASR